MAQTDRFYIGMDQAGASKNTSLKPFAIPDNAYQLLNNAYVFRGRIRKRFGSMLMQATTPVPGYETLQSRLKINIGSTDGAGAFAPGTVPGDVFAIGQLFSIGTQLFTVYQTGTPAAMLSTGAGTGTYNTTTGAYTFAGTLAVSTIVYFYPALPVMGLITKEVIAISNEELIGFDTRFAYRYEVTGWERLGTAVWSGDNADFFWGANWNGLLRSDYYLFVTNNIEADRIKYWDGTTWTTMSPIVNNTSRIHTARIIVPFKDRLVFLNTTEFTETVTGNPYGPTNGTTGNLGATVITAPPGGFAIGQSFIVGTTIFTIADVATPGAQPLTVSAVNNTGAVASATFNNTSSELIITGNNTNRGVGVYFSPDGTVGTSYRYTNRCRYSVNGSPVNVNSFLELTGGFGGYVDAPTKEAIVTAQFLKDRLIVYFESSTWELAYTANQILPFVWQQINTELGAESTFSQVPFDTVVLGVGNVGIHACNGSNVERIDDKIPDEVFKIHNDSNGIERVAGIRDYYVEMVYWSFPDPTRSDTFPFNNKVLVYNYKTGSWAMNDDSITAFGYYNTTPSQQETWATDLTTWETDNSTWFEGVTVQGRFKSVVAGNQEGYVVIVNPDKNRNAPALQITNAVITDIQTITFTVVNHNLEAGFNSFGDYIVFESVQGLAGLNGLIFPVDTVIDANTFKIIVTPGSVTGSYLGGGTIARVSSMDIVTKQYNFYANQGVNASINKVDFLVDKTSGGQVTIDYSISSSGESSLFFGGLSGALVGTGILETSPYDLVPLEQTQERLWHPIYPMANGECVQLNIYMTDDQLRNPAIAWSDFELHAMIFSATRTGRLQ